MPSSPFLWVRHEGIVTYETAAVLLRRRRGKEWAGKLAQNLSHKKKTTYYRKYLEGSAVFENNNKANQWLLYSCQFRFRILCCFTDLSDDHELNRIVPS